MWLSSQEFRNANRVAEFERIPRHENFGISIPRGVSGEKRFETFVAWFTDSGVFLKKTPHGESNESRMRFLKRPLMA